MEENRPRKVNTIKNYVTPEQIKERLRQKKKNPVKHRRIISINPQDFADILKLEGDLVLRDRGELDNQNNPLNFEIFPHLKNAINQYYSYTTGKQYFINSGFCLSGAAGLGKTVLQLSFLNMLRTIGAIKGYHHINARTFHKLDDRQKYEQGVLFIEEFGKNPAVIKDYGTEEKPLENLLMRRYETNQITFADANLSEKTLKEIYGPLLSDRFNRMFNFVELPSECNGKRINSIRKK